MAGQEPMGYLLGFGQRPMPIHRGDVFTVGRDPQNSIHLRDVMCSRQHAVFECDGGGKITLRDLGSRNGTWLNDDQAAAKKRLGLTSGDCIRIGGHLIFFVSVHDELEPQRQRRRADRYVEDMDTVYEMPVPTNKKNADAAPSAHAHAERATPSAGMDIRQTIMGMPPLRDEDSAALSGSLKRENMAQLIQFIHTTGKSGDLVIQGTSLSGVIAFFEGSVVFAEAGRYQGAHAIYALARQFDGGFRFEQTEAKPDHTAQDIKEPMAKIIFECCRRIDEARHSGMS